MQIFIYIKNNRNPNAHTPPTSTPPKNSKAHLPPQTAHHASYTRRSLHAAIMAKPTILQHAPKPISTTKTSRKTILSPSNRLQQPPPPSKFPNQHHLNTHNRHKDTKVNRQKKTKPRPLLSFIYIFACLNNKNITPYCIAPYILLLSSREKNSGAYLRPPSKSATTLTAIPSELSRRSVRLPRDPCITRSNPDQPPKPSK